MCRHFVLDIGDDCNSENGNCDEGDGDDDDVDNSDGDDADGEGVGDADHSIRSA